MAKIILSLQFTKQTASYSYIDSYLDEIYFFVVEIEINLRSA